MNELQKITIKKTIFFTIMIFIGMYFLESFLDKGQDKIEILSILIQSILIGVSWGFIMYYYWKKNGINP